MPRSFASSTRASSGPTTGPAISSTRTSPGPSPTWQPPVRSSPTWACYFDDERLRLAFTFQSKYLGMSPWKCPSLFSILSYLEYKYGVYHVQGGLCRISEKMAEIATDAGAEIRLGEPVEQVLTAGRTALRCAPRLRRGHPGRCGRDERRLRACRHPPPQRKKRLRGQDAAEGLLLLDLHALPRARHDLPRRAAPPHPLRGRLPPQRLRNPGRAHGLAGHVDLRAQLLPPRSQRRPGGALGTLRARSDHQHPP